MPEKEPVTRICIGKERETQAKRLVIGFEGSVALAPLPMASTECDKGCEGPVRTQRHIAGIALPSFFDKISCPMQPSSEKNS